MPTHPKPRDLTTLMFTEATVHGKTNTVELTGGEYKLAEAKRLRDYLNVVIDWLEARENPTPGYPSKMPNCS